MLPRPEDDDTLPVQRDDGQPLPVTESRPSLKAAGAAKAKPAQQSLFFSPPPAPQPDAESFHEARVSARQLWLCMHLPALPLEALNADGKATEAVFENQQGNRRVLLVDSRAGQSGITPGQSVNAALALAPGLKLEERDPQKEDRVLRRLAGWAERFTSIVSIEPPDLLLLEIGGSLQLFGDVRALQQQVEGGLFEQGFKPAIAIAPTPLASVWLARAGGNACIENLSRLAGALSPLPLHCLEWPLTVREALNGMGIYCIGDCLRLPRQGFARRFGASRLLQLDRALGRLPDPRKSYRTPARFCEERELPEEQANSELLLEVCRQLLANLEDFLTRRQIEVRHVQFSFFHLRSAATLLTLGCMQAGRNREQWSELLAIRFERLALPEPVIAIRLRSGTGQTLQAEAGSLFRANGRRRSSMTHLLERLGARLGDDCVHRLTTVAEHRPEYSWSPAAVKGDLPDAAIPDRAHACHAPLLLDIPGTGSLLLRRPLWMLPEPQPLGTVDDLPAYHGPLELIEGPERIETGWWDGKGIARDYFVAVNRHGAHFWIYRNRDREAGWYLHGIFG